ncbi:MAG: peptidase rane alanine aminopeptidase [Bryobacterales bacterium]|jgi:tetratricopeptide (TPR) repeat protein|nr:peptidase rane alanine aminopeptidase [Bryobacterales bacterium]
MPVKLLGSVALAAVTVLAQGQGQSQRPRMDVDNYTIDAQVDPSAQTIRATAKVRFTPLDDATSLSFELNNALNLDSVTDEAGRQVPASRVAQDMSVRLSLAAPLPKGKPATLTFVYGGKLTGAEESPVWGIKFAAIHPEFAYLLYPARWFPVNDYTTDRFTADLRVTVPSGYKVIASGLESADAAADGKTAVRFQVASPSFPGSFAVVRGDPTTIASGGINTSLYFRERKDMAGAYGQETGRAMEFLSGLYGPLPNRNLMVIETEAGTPNGYSAPGILFLSPRAIGSEVNAKLLANQVSRQWWGGLVSPSTRNHMWIENGMARYAELLYTENVNGAGAMESQVRDTYVEALTVEQPPLMQSARLEDYSPEFWAATAGKGAAVLHMLRSILGDDKFFQLLKTVPQRYAGKSISTADFQKLAEELSGQSLNYFFLQWIESSGAPEFKLEYTMFRTSKGFRVNGKISQDLDTFRMPVALRIDTEGNPEEKKIEVAGTSTDFAVETFGKPKNVVLDPKGQLLRYDNDMRVAVAIKRGEQFMEVAEYIEALNEYKKALDVKRNSSLAHYRTADAYFLQGNYQAAANEFREALSGDLEPKWTEVWAHIHLGMIYDITDQRDRAVNEYKLAQRTKDNTQGALEEAQKYITAKYERQRNTN